MIPPQLGEVVSQAGVVALEDVLNLDLRGLAKDTQGVKGSDLGTSQVVELLLKGEPANVLPSRSSPLL
jgi:hypothetical protein